ncbi:MAG: hypothetical protein R2854_11845 [Caldilineaceae bacterium]
MTYDVCYSSTSRSRDRSTRHRKRGRSDEDKDELIGLRHRAGDDPACCNKTLPSADPMRMPA